MSSASAPRTSPTMIRSGRIRNAFFTRSRATTSPRPSEFGGRVSSRTTCSCCSRSSAASSIVTTRSSAGMNELSALSSVVLPGAGTAGDQHIQPRLHAAGEQLQHLHRQCAVRDQLLDREVGAESTDRQHRSVERQRRNDRVDARAVGETGVDHRRRLVDATADAAHDAVDDRQQVRVVPELRADARELTLSLDEDVLRAVDEDVRDRRVAEQRLDRARGR